MFLTLLQSGGAGPGVITGTLSAVESGADTFSATGVVEGGSTGRPSYWSDRPWRPVPFIPIAPRRPRRKRQEDLIFLGR
jgi:hypothetical protein